MDENDTAFRRPEREEIALREAGRTEVSRTVSALLAALFLATVALVPVLEPVLGDPSGVLETALGVLPDAARAAREDGLLAANRALLSGIERFEDSLEDESFLRARILPPVQTILTRGFGVGSEEVILGLDGWLFLRADFEHVTGPGFLESRVLRREIRAGERGANPVPAIVAFARDLDRRGIRLLVMPTPVKPTVHPELLSSSARAAAPIHNPSFGPFLARLRTEGVEVFDPSTLYADTRTRRDGPLYLRSDTHWTPQTVELTARALAARLDALVDWRQPPAEGYFGRRSIVTGTGDLRRLLEASESEPAAPVEQTEVSRVVTRRGQSWKPDRDAEVLLLGDSFTNIYSDASLGWGTGAGLAEHLSLALGRGVDRIALNAGGSWTSRQALSRSAGAEGAPNRLEGKRVVVYQFATRELSIGDWRVLPIPGGGVRAGDAPDSR